MAQISTPLYYPLGTVSDPVIEPEPVVIPIVDTFLFGLDYRFAIPAAGPYVAIP